MSLSLMDGTALLQNHMTQTHAAAFAGPSDRRSVSYPWALVSMGHLVCRFQLSGVAHRPHDGDHIHT